MDLAIIGLERSGKTTVFNAVTRGHAQTGTFGATEPNIGVVKVPDERLDRVCALLRPKKITYAEARYLDFPGGLSVREGPEGALLAALAQSDALVHVVRAFRSPSVPHPESTVDPDRDIAGVNLELAFADARTFEKRVERLEAEVRSGKAGERGPGERELALVQRLKEALAAEQPLRSQELSADERRTLSGYQLLTDKPLLLVINIDEADVGRREEIEAEFESRWAAPGVSVAALCGTLEQELTELSDDEAAAFRADLGMVQGGLERMLQLSQRALGLISMFTVGDTEGRAWAVPEGSTAQKAAGKIHSDIERGFIRAEVIGWQEMEQCGSWPEARKRGLIRTEGKGYLVQDGEIVNVLFNV